MKACQLQLDVLLPLQLGEHNAEKQIALLGITKVRKGL
jgi:hypothetical protein